MRRAMIAAALLGAVLFAPAVRAQTSDERQPPGAGQLAPADSPASPRRRALEQQLRVRIAQVVRNRLQLDDRQFARLQEVNRRYDVQRRALVQRERRIRVELRGELLRGDDADQGHVSDLMQQLVQVQQDRLDLFRAEQRDLSAFLTPVQRAKYAALQEQIRKRVAQFRQQQLRRRGP